MKCISNFIAALVILLLTTSSSSLTLEGAWLECTPHTKTVYGDCCGAGQTLTKYCWASQEQLNAMLNNSQKAQGTLKTTKLNFQSQFELNNEQIMEKNSEYYVNKINQQAVYLQCKAKKCLGDATHYHYHKQSHEHLHYFSMAFQEFYEELGIDFPQFQNDFNAYYLIYHSFNEKSQHGKQNEKKQFDIPNATHQVEMFHEHAHWAYHDHLHFLIPYADESNANLNLLKLKSVVLSKVPKKQRSTPQMLKQHLTAQLLKEEIKSYTKIQTKDLEFIQDLNTQVKQDEEEHLQIPLQGGDEILEVPLKYSDIKMQQPDGLHYASVSAEHSHYFYIKESSMQHPKGQDLTNPEIHKQQEKFLKFSQVPLEEVKENPNKVVIHYQTHQVIHVHDHYILIVPDEAAIDKIVQKLSQYDFSHYPRVQPVEKLPETLDGSDVCYIESNIKVPEGDFEHYEYQSAEKNVVWNQAYSGNVLDNNIFDESKFESELQESTSTINKYDFTYKFGDSPKDSHTHYHYTYSIAAHQHYVKIQFPTIATLSHSNKQYIDIQNVDLVKQEEGQSTLYKMLMYLFAGSIVVFLYYSYKNYVNRKPQKKRRSKNALRKQRSVEKLLIEVGQL